MLTSPEPLGLRVKSPLLRVLIVPGTVNDPSLFNVTVLTTAPSAPTFKLIAPPRSWRRISS